MADTDKLLDHNYDGIQEYDNDLPTWWVALFWVTIIWSVIYIFYFHMQATPQEQLAEEMKSIAALQGKTAAAANAAVTEESLLAMVNDPAIIKKGQEIFNGKCGVCHGPQGGGLIGPNLTDNAWIHGGKMLEIRNTIMEGVPAKGMISWKTLMPADDVNAVVAFVRSLKGTTPPNPKAPEGIAVE